MPTRSFWLLAFLIAAPIVCAAVRQDVDPIRHLLPPVAQREQMMWRSPRHDSEFLEVPHTARTSCAANQAPEAITTPNPLLPDPDIQLRITVSFIVGTDGRVHSPLILESAGPTEDRTVLNAVRTWRYRPARCNGVPTETEGKVEFSNP